MRTAPMMLKAAHQRRHTEECASADSLRSSPWRMRQQQSTSSASINSDRARRHHFRAHRRRHRPLDDVELLQLQRQQVVAESAPDGTLQGFRKPPRDRERDCLAYNQQWQTGWPSCSACGPGSPLCTQNSKSPGTARVRSTLSTVTHAVFRVAEGSDIRAPCPRTIDPCPILDKTRHDGWGRHTADARGRRGGGVGYGPVAMTMRGWRRDRRRHRRLLACAASSADSTLAAARSAATAMLVTASSAKAAACWPSYRPPEPRMDGR